MSIEDKICASQDLTSRLVNLPRPLVMTNGVFDVLHRGHVTYLNRAAELGASLVVAVNSDASARMLGKGQDRPLNLAEDRAYVLAGLQSVKLVTFFETRTPVELIRIIRPDTYVKGGDYDMEGLEETHVVRSWGGQSLAIPFVKGFSTTALVQRMRQPVAAVTRKAVFLDRDGVINKDKAYIHRWEDFEFVPGAIEAMRRLQEAGFVIVIVTNQSGIARGFYTEAQYQRLTASFRQELTSNGLKLGGIYHCPHHPMGRVQHLSVDCECRKPAPGLILQAARELGLSLHNSVLIGDKATDIEAAHLAGIGYAYQVKSDNDESRLVSAMAKGHYCNLLECVDQILHN